MERGIFDLLGIRFREDSYTNLLIHAWNELPSFRTNLLNLLLKEESAADDRENWKIYGRNAFDDGKAGKNVPDLILVNRAKSEVILIENKLLSKEGKEQTVRYASGKFKEVVARKFDVKGDAKFRFFFLTLDGIPPQSPHFQKLTHSEVVACLPKVLPKSKLALLLEEYKELVRRYEEWPKPKDEDEVLNYLKDTRDTVPPFWTFSRLVESLEMFREYDQLLKITGNQGCGYIPVAQWSLPHWKGRRTDGKGDGSRSYDIHLEFQWNTCKNSLALYLHYQTLPYLTRKQMIKTHPWFQESFHMTRDAVYNCLKERKSSLQEAGWTIKKSYLMLAKHIFDSKMTVKELRRKIFELGTSIREALDYALETPLKQPLLRRNFEEIGGNGEMRLVIMDAYRFIRCRYNLDEFVVKVGADDPWELSEREKDCWSMIDRWLQERMQMNPPLINKYAGEIQVFGQNNLAERDFVFSWRL